MFSDFKTLNRIKIEPSVAELSPFESQDGFSYKLPHCVACKQFIHFLLSCLDTDDSATDGSIFILFSVLKSENIASLSCRGIMDLS